MCCAWVGIVYWLFFATIGGFSKCDIVTDSNYVIPCRTRNLSSHGADLHGSTTMRRSCNLVIKRTWTTV